MALAFVLLSLFWQDTLPILGVLALPISVMIYRGQRLWKRRLNLAAKGTILVGEVHDSRLRDYWAALSYEVEEDSSMVVPAGWLLLRYRFVNPIGQVVEGNASRVRLDLDDASLPTPGTPLAILYLSDDNYVVL